MSGAILTSPEIEAMMRMGKINLDPYDPKQLNPNSYNVKLSDEILIYDKCRYNYNTTTNPDLIEDHILDTKKDNPTKKLTISEGGMVLLPGELYLGSTVEFTETEFPLVPMLEGRSSFGRLGLSIHITAGFGDVGFRGKWTLEMSVIRPLRIYSGVEIAQIYYLRTYGSKPPNYNGKYQGETTVLSSKIHLESENASNNTR